MKGPVRPSFSSNLIIWNVMTGDGARHWAILNHPLRYTEPRLLLSCRTCMLIFRVHPCGAKSPEGLGRVREDSIRPYVVVVVGGGGGLYFFCSARGATG